MPLPPSINHQYRANDGRRFLSPEASKYKSSLEREFRRLYVKGLLKGAWAKNFEDKFLRLRYEFYFATPFRRDLDSGLKLAQDLVCGGLRVNDNRVVEIQMVKRVDKKNPRLVVVFEVLDEWDFEGESSLFHEDEIVDEDINLIDAMSSSTSAIPSEGAVATSALAGVGNGNGNGHNGSKVTSLEDLMRKFNWR
jgi:Holliday junction resolvase RusA-like endonuclease